LHCAVLASVFSLSQVGGDDKMASAAAAHKGLSALYRCVTNRFRNRILDDQWQPSPLAGVMDFHRTLPGYQPTPLVACPALAKALGLENLWIKDESKRFGLNAFKVLGASYAIHQFIHSEEGRRLSAGQITFSTATDGNHGRAVAWAARRLGCQAKIFVPANMVAARRQALVNEGADVIVVEGTYDEAVRRAASESAKYGWQTISDTAYEGYTTIPRWIMEGYGTLFAESQQQLASQLGRSAPPDAVLLQAGVGGLACAGALFYARSQPERMPLLVSVEPTDAECLAESAAAPHGELSIAKGQQNSIMAGLNCGTPSLLAWPVIRSWYDAFLAVDDLYAERAIRLLYEGYHGDPPIVSGESGAAGLAGLLAIHEESAPDAALADLRQRLQGKSVLLISTEGDTDPVNYQRIISSPRA
jgi:diaminopropionate ammonia-lyase